MRSIALAIAILAAFIATSAGAQQKAVDSDVIVVVDASRGAMLRWMLPTDGLPAGGYRVERSSGRGTPEIVGIVRRGETTLTTDEQRSAAEAIISGKVTSKNGNDVTIAQAGTILATIADPALAAYLGLSFEDRSAPSGASVIYSVTPLSATGAAAGQTLRSLPVLITPMQPPSPPDDLRAQPSRDGMLLFWSKPSPGAAESGAVTYEIRRRDAGRETKVTPRPVLKVRTRDAEAPGAIDKSPTIEAKNVYTIVAYDIFGRAGTPSAPVEVIYPDFDAIDPPKSISATASDGKIVVTWEAPANPNRKEWRVVRAPAPDTLGELLPRVPGDQRQIVDTRPVTGSSVYYRITAVNRRGDEGEPRTSSAVLVRAEPPSAPTALTATLKTGRVVLTWTAPKEPVAGYQIQRSADNRTWTVLNPVVGSEPRYVDHYPADVTGKFYYRVISWARDDTASTPSEVLAVNLPDTRPPSPPLVNHIDGAEGKVTLRFTRTGPEGDASSYAILRTEHPYDNGVVIATGDYGTDDVTWIDGAVTPGARYFYRVVSLDQAGNRSEPTDPASAVRVASGAVPAPPNPVVKLETTPFRRVAVTFKPLEDGTVSLILERKASDGRWIVVQGPFPATESRAIDIAPPREKLLYRLATASIDGTPGPRSAEVAIDATK